MRLVKYLGEPVNLSRFGAIKSGGKLEMLESEWQGVKDDPEFEFQKYTEEGLTKQGVLPVSCPSYDLRTVAWNSGRFDRVLGRLNRTHLERISVAMQLLGLPVKGGRENSPVALQDSIYTHAVIEGWNEMTRDEILTCGVFIPGRKRKRAKGEKEAGKESEIVAN